MCRRTLDNLGSRLVQERMSWAVTDTDLHSPSLDMTHCPITSTSRVQGRSRSHLGGYTTPKQWVAHPFETSSDFTLGVAGMDFLDGSSWNFEKAFFFFPSVKSYSEKKPICKLVIAHCEPFSPTFWTKHNQSV